MSQSGVVNTAKGNTGSNGKTPSVRKEIRNSRVWDREGIKRILDGHADTKWTEAQVNAWLLERVRGKWHRCR